MEHKKALARFGLKFNPFPTASTGSACLEKLWIPATWADDIADKIERLDTGSGAKAMMIVGAYGTGKTFLLQRIKHELQKRRIQSYFFHNPETSFCGLANHWLRQVGRWELSKAMWEMLYEPRLSSSPHPRLVDLSFPDWLWALKGSSQRERALRDLQEAMRESQLTQDADVALCFAQRIVDTRERPYYAFRDFMPRTSHSLATAGQEAKYFQTLIRVLLRVSASNGIAFLIDEFADVALVRRMAKRQRAEYTATLRRLLDTAAAEDFWLMLSMTPEGLEQTHEIVPSLMERFGPHFTMPPLSDQDSYDLVRHRLQGARMETAHEGLWPFEDEAVAAIQPANRVVPRRLVKVFTHALAQAIREQIQLPIPTKRVQEAEQCFAEPDAIHNISRLTLL